MATWVPSLAPSTKASQTLRRTPHCRTGLRGEREALLLHKDSGAACSLGFGQAAA